MNLQPFLLITVIFTAAFFALPGRSQTPDPLPREPKRIVAPDTPQNALLVDAGRRGDLDSVRAALQQGASADTRVGSEGSPQSVPVALLTSQSLPEDRRKSLAIFRLLIENVAAPNATDDDHSRALVVAANGGQARLIELLLDKGADANARRPVGLTAAWTTERRR